MLFSFKKWLKSCFYAIEGIKYAFRQQNFVLITIIAFLAIGLGFVLKISYFEWLILILTIASVLSLEAFNTVWEKTMDFVEPSIFKKVKDIKDMAAGAVLIFCFFSLIIGAIIFLPKIIPLLTGLKLY